jgi:purine nucleoside phosphorylase
MTIARDALPRHAGANTATRETGNSALTLAGALDRHCGMAATATTRTDAGLQAHTAGHRLMANDLIYPVATGPTFRTSRYSSCMKSRGISLVGSKEPSTARA